MGLYPLNKFSTGELIKIKETYTVSDRTFSFVNLNKQTFFFSRRTPMFLVEVQEETGSALVMIKNHLCLFRLKWLNENCVSINKTVDIEP